MANNYNFENLILLVGTNPLPNYVVAKYFLINNQNLKKIWLVHSEKQNDDAGTKEIAERIKDVIQKEHPKMNFDYCPLADISNARTIKSTVERIILPKIDSMHFNYTGGTKAMAVHVYRAIERAENIRDRSFSYLDAREFRLKDDMDGFKTDDLRKSIKISFETLMNLHGYEKSQQGQNFSGEDWNAVLNEFGKIINDGKLKDYLNWKKDIIRKIYYNKKGEFDDKIKDVQLRIKCNLDNVNKHPFRDCALKIITKIPKEYSILDDNCNLWIPEDGISKINFKTRIEPSIGFLDGKWLENYVYRILKKGFNEEIPIELNWHLTKISNKKPFELDIILLIGYQINGISITTDHTEDRCKLKGFEILHRVKQIGGDEAKAILITCLAHNGERGDQIRIMEEDLKTETGGTEKLRVLGIEDLAENELLQKIKDLHRNLGIT